MVPPIARSGSGWPAVPELDDSRSSMAAAAAAGVPSASPIAGDAATGPDAGPPVAAAGRRERGPLVSSSLVPPLLSPLTDALSSASSPPTPPGAGGNRPAARSTALAEAKLRPSAPI